MTYADITIVPSDRRAVYLAFSRRMADVYREHGATRIVNYWQAGDPLSQADFHADGLTYDEASCRASRASWVPPIRSRSWSRSWSGLPVTRALWVQPPRPPTPGFWPRWARTLSSTGAASWLRASRLRWTCEAHKRCSYCQARASRVSWA